MPGNWPVPFGKGPSEKDPRHGNLVGGLLHSTGRGWKRSPTPPRQSLTLPPSRLVNAFDQVVEPLITEIT